MDFAQIPWVQGGAVAVLAAVAWLIYRGLLVPRSVLDDVRADRDARLAEKSAEVAEYKAAWLAAEKARHEQDSQVAELMELARTTDAFIRSIPTGGPHDAVAP